MTRNFLLVLLLFMLSMVSALAQIQACLEIRNENRIGDTFHFDIFIGAATANSFIDNSTIYFTYSTNAFGNTPVANNQVVADKVGIMADSFVFFKFGALVFWQDKYDIRTITDNAIGRIAIVWKNNAYDNNPKTGNLPTYAALDPLSQVSTITPDSIFHVKIGMVDTTFHPCVAIDTVVRADLHYIIPLDTLCGDCASCTCFRSYDSQGRLCAPSNNPPNCQAIVLAAYYDAFTAQKQADGSVRLDWTVASEYASDYFIVEKAVPGRIFEEIGRLDAAYLTTEPTYYQFEDRSPLATANLYRITAVNVNGDVARSDVELIVFDQGGATKYLVYPNPATNFLQLQSVKQLEVDEVSYSIVSMNGSRVMSASLNVTTGGRGLIDISDLPAGVYVIKLRAEDEDSLIRFVKY